MTRVDLCITKQRQLALPFQREQGGAVDSLETSCASAPDVLRALFQHLSSTARVRLQPRRCQTSQSTPWQLHSSPSPRDIQLPFPLSFLLFLAQEPSGGLIKPSPQPWVIPPWMWQGSGRQEPRENTTDSISHQHISYLLPLLALSVGNSSSFTNTKIHTG